jgi:nucleotide-binding universal stress UspA family protein
MGRSNDLLSFEEVRQKLHATVSPKRRLRDIPLDAIVGSVGRNTDFTRDFMPLNPTDVDRWARVKAAKNDSIGVPPIEVYQIDQVYFVLDGNHRVSVARESRDTHIQAYVTEVQTRVPLTPDVSPDDLIVKAMQADFLEHTGLDRSRPGSDLSMTIPGKYRLLEAQIDVQRAALTHERGEVPFEQAAAHWYDAIYLPIVHVIRDQGILREFPGRTEADLYVWIAEHRAEIEQELGWQVGPNHVASDLTNRLGQSSGRAITRLGERLLDVVTPEALAGPAPAALRPARHTTPENQRLLADLLVGINGEEAGWYALDHALFVAQQEGARLAGLHVVASAAERDSPAMQTLRAEFDRRCAQADVPGRLAIEIGVATRQICERARWTDLIVVSLSYPPGDEPIKRLRSGFRTLVQRCPRPILAVPNGSSTPATPPRRALLPYDGSPKAEEALFIATYLALRWKLALTVVTVIEDGQTTSATLDRARSYLEEHAVQADYLIEHGSAADAIINTAESRASDVILIGGYAFNPLIEIVLGSVVDEVLRVSRRPVLICQ